MLEGNYWAIAQSAQHLVSIRAYKNQYASSVTLYYLQTSKQVLA